MNETTQNETKEQPTQENVAQKKGADVVTKDMTIGDIVQKHPDAVPIMLKYGLHCVGCGASGVETLEQGSLGHGMPMDVFEKMLAEINEVATKKDESPNGFTITEAAAKKALHLAQAERHANACLRITVVPGGCSGFRYDFKFADGPGAKDIVVEAHGLRVLLDSSSGRSLDGAVLDYVETLEGSGFKIDNPNAEDACGCGKSFS